MAPLHTITLLIALSRDPADATKDNITKTLAKITPPFRDDVVGSEDPARRHVSSRALVSQQEQQARDVRRHRNGRDDGRRNGMRLTTDVGRLTTSNKAAAASSN